MRHLLDNYRMEDFVMSPQFLRGMSNGFYFSPDTGCAFEVKDKMAYCETGERFDTRTVLIRSMPTTPRESFAEWTDEKRAQVLQRNQEQWRLNEARRATEQQRREDLRASAKSKLTDEEYAACCYPEDR